MFRTTITAFVAAATLGISTSSAAPVSGAAIAKANSGKELIQWVGWIRQRRHSVVPTRTARRDEFCYLRGRRGDPRLFMLQQARGCFQTP